MFRYTEESGGLVFIIIFAIVGIDDDGGVLGIVRRRRTVREFLFHGGEINCLWGILGLIYLVSRASTFPDNKEFLLYVQTIQKAVPTQGPLVLPTNK
jgi:hypothetical protein